MLELRDIDPPVPKRSERPHTAEGRGFAAI
jgi:hypothetical protein